MDRDRGSALLEIGWSFARGMMNRPARRPPRDAENRAERGRVRRTGRELPGGVALLIVGFALGCGSDAPVAPTAGAMHVTVSTTGTPASAGAYAVAVDNGAPQVLGPDSSLTVSDLSSGSHTVELSGVPAGCAVAGDNPRAVAVTAGATSEVAFAVTCAAPQVGSIAISTTTSGESPDPDGYTVSVDGSAGQQVAASGTVTLTDVAPGDHLIALGDIAANCALASGSTNPQTVTVAAGQTTQVTFAVTCAAVPGGTGSIAVATATTGAAPDPDGYTLSVDGGAAQPIGANATVTIEGVAPGQHSVALAGLAANCSVAQAGNPRTVTVAAQQTATVTFTIDCEAVPGSPGHIVFAATLSGEPYDLYVINPDGTGRTRLTDTPEWNENAPVLSPDGARIAFASDRTGNFDIYVMNVDGSGLTQLTTDTATDVDPTWSPDGNRIAFNTDRDGNAEIYVMNADGSGQTNLTTNAAADATPEWSPDGSRIAFSSNRNGNAEIYLMNADGTGLVDVTSHAADDYGPAWSPDGQRLAFLSTRDDPAGDIYVMGTDGTGVVRVTTNVGIVEYRPTWSLDGTRLVFADGEDLVLVNADGTGLTPLTSTPARETDPAWGP